MTEDRDGVTDRNVDDEAKHDIVSLRRQYGVSRHEARRIIERFGNSKADLDLLLASRGRTNTHRQREIHTDERDAAFGID